MNSHFHFNLTGAPVTAVITPDWRRMLAVDIVSRPRTQKPDGRRGRYASTKSLDPLTVRYIEFLRKTLGYTTERGMRTVARIYPDLFLAQKVSSELTRRPLEIQARLLAGQSSRAIARAVGLPVPTVQAYMGLFFDVRKRLKAKSWIRWIAIGLPLDGPPSVEGLLLWHSWKRGPSVIQPWFDFLNHQAENHDLRTEIGRQRAAIEVFVGMRQLPNVPEVRRSLVKKIAYTTQNLPEIPKSASIAGVLSRNETKILAEIAWKPPQTAVESVVPCGGEVPCSPSIAATSYKYEVTGKAG